MTHTNTYTQLLGVILDEVSLASGGKMNKLSKTFRTSQPKENMLMFSTGIRNIFYHKYLYFP